MSRFFDPKSYYVVLVDQRGCGKSRPFGEIKDNTTQDLDILVDNDDNRELLSFKIANILVSKCKIYLPHQKTSEEAASNGAGAKLQNVFVLDYNIYLCRVYSF